MTPALSNVEKTPALSNVEKTPALSNAKEDTSTGPTELTAS